MGMMGSICMRRLCNVLVREGSMGRFYGQFVLLSGMVVFHVVYKFLGQFYFSFLFREGLSLVSVFLVRKQKTHVTSKYNINDIGTRWSDCIISEEGYNSKMSDRTALHMTVFMRAKKPELQLLRQIIL